MGFQFFPCRWVLSIIIIRGHKSEFQNYNVLKIPAMKS